MSDRNLRHDRSWRVRSLIREKRKALGSSARKLGAAVGVSHVHVLDIENGRRTCSPRLAVLLGHHFGASEEMRDCWLKDEAERASARYLDADWEQASKRVRDE